MKRLVFTLAICLGCIGILGAQNVWKPIEMNGEFLGVSADGSIFSNWGYSGLHRSQDEGATWELTYDLSYVNSKHFIINDNDRIFILIKTTIDSIILMTTATPGKSRRQASPPIG